MAGDFTGCAAIRKKASNGIGTTNSSSSSSASNKNNDENGGGGGGGGGCGNNGKEGRKLVDNNVHHYKDPLKTYKIVILGDGGVGKSGE